MEAFLADLYDTSAAEAAAVVLGIAYSLLAVRRNRLCWLAGGASSALLAWVFADARLPMQATLQLYYVAMAAYGWWHWGRQSEADRPAVSTWPLKFHLAAWAVILTLSAISARWLAAESEAAWPYLDSVVTWASVLSTWFVARVKIENWLYWMGSNAVLVYLSAAQGLAFVSFLFAVYLVIAAIGFLTWLKALRTRQSVPA